MRAGAILETVLYAEDLAAARHFYETVLGLELYWELAPRFAFFRNRDQMLLVFNPKLTAMQSAGDGPPLHGATGAGHVCFRATRAEIEQWQTHLTAHGVETESLMDWPDGGRSLYVRDPAGNSVEFAESRIWDLPEMKTLKNQKIIIATHNKGKLEEFRQLFAPHGVNAVSAGELGLPEPAETENTFKGNARIKALAAMQASGLIAMSDDSGLCVDALKGDPGVYTADWAGPARDWSMAMRLVEEKLQAVSATTPEQRRGAFMCTLCVIWPDGTERFYEGRAPGHLVWPPRGVLGHGYDPVFMPEGESVTFGEMQHAHKNKISHRARALEAMFRDLF
jgi:non-canonical purine NTP pyrophosphatase (RdgB/HAM1 family)